MRLIDADALHDAILRDEKLDGNDVNWAVNRIINYILNAPTIDTTFREVVAYECGQKSVEERPKGNEKNGKGCWNCQHCKRVNKELVGEEWRCDLTDLYFGYHTLIDHWCRHWAKLKR